MPRIIYLLVLAGTALILGACTRTPNADVNNYRPDQGASGVILPEGGEASGVSSSSSPNIMKSPNEQPDLTAEYSGALLKTSLGDITVRFYAEDSPLTVNNFLNLAQAGFYDGTKFHRVISGFMIQGGDPLSREDDVSLYGTGGPGYRFADEINSRKLVRGSLAMANAGPGTNGSQFFIVTAPDTPWLDGRHTNFGEVVSGMDVVQQIEGVATGPNDRPLTAVVVERIELLK